MLTHAYSMNNNKESKNSKNINDLTDIYVKLTWGIKTHSKSYFMYIKQKDKFVQISLERIFVLLIRFNSMLNYA